MIRLPLTNGGITLVDDEDHSKVSKYKWYKSKREDKKYIVQSTNGRPAIILSRFIMNPPQNMVVDHKDGNGLNNQKKNLRICTVEENNRNQRKLYVNNTSGYRGVVWSKAHKKWHARINVHYKRISLGYYYDIEEAARAHDKAAKKYHKEFASLNFPEAK